MKVAIDAPMECALLATQVMPLCRKIAEIGNVNIISDAGVAVLAARAAFKSAELNVYVNAAGLEDKVFADKQIQEVRKLSDIVEKEERDIFDYVSGVILKL